MAQACAAWAARVARHASASSSAKRSGKCDGGGKGGRVEDAQSLARGGQPRFPICAWRIPRVQVHDAPSSPGDGIPIGAYVCLEAATVQLIRTALMDTARLKAHGVTRFDPSTWTALGFGDAAADAFPGDASSHPWAVHAFALGPREREPDELISLMVSGAAEFMPGLRLGNPACYVNLGKKGKHVREALDDALTSTFVPPVSRSSREEEWQLRRDLESAARGLGQVTPPAWSPPKPTNVFQPFTYSELFAGVGGFAFALSDIGGVGVFASELCPHARRTYILNHGCGGGFSEDNDGIDANNTDNPKKESNGGPLVTGDITDVCSSIIPKHDLLTGGFPCQSFSKRGKRKGVEDPRGVLYLEICRVLTDCRPSAFLLENVDGLVDMDDGAVLETVVDALRRCGYGVTYKIMDAADETNFFVPQKRLRVFFAGFRDDHVDDGALDRFKWPCGELDTSETTRPDIRDILEVEEDALEVPGTAMSSCEVSAYQMERAVDFFDRFRAGRKMDEKHDDETKTTDDACSSNKTTSYLAADVHGVARTLCASYRKSSAYNAELVPPSESTRRRRPRYYTAREASRLMGFPETFQPDPDRAWHELGNSVAVPLVREIAAEMLTAMGWGKR